MQKRLNIEYPAYVYKKSTVVVANCVLYNLVTFGNNETEAVENLQKILQQNLVDFDITIKPIYEVYKAVHIK